MVKGLRDHQAMNIDRWTRWTTRPLWSPHMEPLRYCLGQTDFGLYQGIPNHSGCPESPAGPDFPHRIVHKSHMPLNPI